jgi:hypothetical protein
MRIWQFAAIRERVLAVHSKTVPEVPNGKYKLYVFLRWITAEINTNQSWGYGSGPGSSLVKSDQRDLGVLGAIFT